MNWSNKNGRRLVLKQIGTVSGSLSLPFSIPINLINNKNFNSKLKMKGNIKHSVCRWCFEQIPIEEFAYIVKSMGIEGVDLVGPKDWKILKKYDLVSSMCNGAEISLTQGWNNKEFHNTLVDSYKKHIEMVAAAGYKNLICFSGNRGTIDDLTGLKNCERGLKKIISYAEKKGVIIQMELLNSKIDHPDYMCDNSRWGFELCKSIDSENFKILYDIYHMQISEGDIIRTITENIKYIGHFHTAGVPGRNEIDENQELFYPSIMKSIVEMDFRGFVAQEFIPKNNPIKSLKKAVKLCDI